MLRHTGAVLSLLTAASASAMGHPEAAVTLCAAANSCLNRSTSARMPTGIPPAGRSDSGTDRPTDRPAGRLARPGPADNG